MPQYLASLMGLLSTSYKWDLHTVNVDFDEDTGESTQVEAVPLILVFEDLHWVDGETQGFLDVLSESIARE
jgi:hypothetical protein